MIKALFINTSDSNGGAARAAVRIMHGVTQHGVVTQLLVKNKKNFSSEIVSLDKFKPAIKCYRLLDWFVSKFKNKWQQLQWYPYRKTKENVFMSDMRSTCSHGALQKLDYDILHLHWVNQRFLDLRELKTVNKPIIWTLHDSWPFCGVCHYFIDCRHYQSHCGDCPMLHSGKEKDLAYRVFEKKMQAYKDLNLHIVTPSSWLGECAKNSALFGLFPVTVIPNCLDTDMYRPLSDEELKQYLVSAIAQNSAFRAAERAAGEKAAKPIILYGAMNAATDRIKGFASLLSALQELDKQGFEANLLVFGASESDLPMEFKHISVHFMGYISDTNLLVALYNLADVMVVPSLTENLSCAIMESLSCGTPVCCFDIGGNGDMVEHKVNGYLAIEQNSSDLAIGIQWCIMNNQNGLLSHAAREKVIREYTIDKVGKKYYDFYRKIIEK